MSEQSQNIKPKNRLQHLLAKIAGNDTAKTVKPKMKNEFYLNEIAEEGSGGGSGGGGALVIHESTDETYTGEGTKYVLDVTTEELLAAVRAGQVIVMQTIGEGN